MSSQVQPIGTIPSVYRLVSPVVTVNATGGTVEVDANAKFNTNIPLNFYALITKVKWLHVTLIPPTFTSLADNQTATWGVFAQLTEALARTVPSSTDPVFVDEVAYQYVDVLDQGTDVATDHLTGWSGSQFTESVLANPWATQAQQLNLVCNAKQLGGTAVNGPDDQWAAIIEYQLLPSNDAISRYLSTRIQIAGQA